MDKCALLAKVNGIRFYKFTTKSERARKITKQAYIIFYYNVYIYALLRAKIYFLLFNTYFYNTVKVPVVCFVEPRIHDILYSVQTHVIITYCIFLEHFTLSSVSVDVSPRSSIPNLT